MYNIKNVPQECTAPAIALNVRVHNLGLKINAALYNLINITTRTRGQ